MKQIGIFLHRQLLNPTRILFYCLGFALVSLAFNRGLVNLYSLHRDKQKLLEQIVEVKAQIIDLDGKLKQTKDPSFMEHQALDRYDLVEENDLVFVFADE
jgi:hypothetical protein